MISQQVYPVWERVFDYGGALLLLGLAIAAYVTDSDALWVTGILVLLGWISVQFVLVTRAARALERRSAPWPRR